MKMSGPIVDVESGASEPTARDLPPQKGWQRSLLVGAVAYLATTLLLLGATGFARRFIPIGPGEYLEPGPTLLHDWVTWDGNWYASIVTAGYSEKPGAQSNLAFFPVYPLLARGVATLGIDPRLALVFVAHLSLLASFCLLRSYCGNRRPEMEPEQADLAVLCFALFPTTFYCRMAYSESLFVLLCLTALWLMQRGWSLLVVALVIGAATGTRSVGVALIPPFLWELWQRSATREEAVRRALLYGPIAVWGLLAYMGWQQVAFGSFLSFVRAQALWTIGFAMPWAVYQTTSFCCWCNKSPDVWWVNIWFANPIYYALFVALTVLGVRKRWLEPRESLLCAGLLLIPFALQGFRFCMGSHARFASVAVPVYLVLARLVSVVPRSWAALYFAACAVFLAAYSALFVRLYAMY